MATQGDITCGGFTFYNNFDSANLARVELVKIPEISEKDGSEVENKSCKSINSDDNADYEFNLWTKHDCHGTQFQNNNRTWFYFSVKASSPSASVKFNIVNLNKQVKMFSQGMCPVFKVVPGHIHWERIRDKPTYTLDQKGIDFTLTFIFTTPENPKAITYFAFTYPFSYVDLQNYLKKIEIKLAKRTITSSDDVYYQRECAIKSLEGRRMDLITISSFHNISTEREDRLSNMFPEKNEERPFKFWDKKVIFISARVHPGETPSSFVFNGFLNFLLNREDQIAINLRRLYVFKLIPMLNPDGVARGHYRMDTRGINLNRVYLSPNLSEHPTIYAARNLIRYYHHSYQLPKEDENPTVYLGNGENTLTVIESSCAIANVVRDTTTKLLQQVTLMSLDEKQKDQPTIFQECVLPKQILDDMPHGGGEGLRNRMEESNNTVKLESDRKTYTAVGIGPLPKEESGLYLYIDLHGHASKKGVFMYGNYFDNVEDTITCMLLPKLMSVNNANFHFTSCNFTERNMYIIDKRDGMSREGSGRVAVYKLTGLIRSYTLECNYNSGRIVNMLPARIRDGVNKTMSQMFVPPKYTPGVFEAVGAALGPSILDLTNNNPNSRLPNSQYRSLRGVKSYLKLAYVNNMSSPNNKSLHKDDCKVVPSDTDNVKVTDSELSEPSIVGLRGATKSETDIARKSCVLRRSSSLHGTVKHAKTVKKSWQTANRRPFKCHSNNVENGTKVSICGSRNVVASFLKTSGNQLRNSRIGSVGNSSQSRIKKVTRSKQLTTSCKFRENFASSEETAVVKHGAKRMKIVSVKSQKGRPEIGETSNHVSKSRRSLIKKQNVREGTKVIDKQCCKVDQNKSTSSKRTKSTHS